MALPIYSSAYLKSKYGRDEWTAYQRDNPARIIPIQVEEVSTRSLLATLVRIRLTGLGEQEAEKKLLAAMRRYVTPRYSLVCQLDGRAREARGAYEHFQQAGARPVDYKSVLDVLESLSATFEPSVPDLAARLGETVQTLQASSGGA
jgi:hypothetical protein